MRAVTQGGTNAGLSLRSVQTISYTGYYDVSEYRLVSTFVRSSTTAFVLVKEGIAILADDDGARIVEPDAQGKCVFYNDYSGLQMSYNVNTKQMYSNWEKQISLFMGE